MCKGTTREVGVFEFRMRKLWVLGVLVGTAITAVAAEPRSVTPTLRVPPETDALETYNVSALTRIYFHTGSARIGHQGKAALDEAVRRVRERSDFVIELRGYADGGVSTVDNQSLSLDRTREVARFLSEHGVAKERILVLGLGEVDPAGPPLQREHQRVDMRVFVPSAVTVARRESIVRTFIEETWGGK